jgi:hypothetical protein
MATTYEPIATTTLGSAQASYTFSSIPATYTDLIIVASLKADSTTVATPALRFNSDTSTNYSATWVYGIGSGSGSSSRGSNATYLYTGDYSVGVTSANPTTFITHIFNYANTTTYKTVLSRNNQITASGGETGATVGLWRKTPEAITTILYTSTNGANYAAGSTFTLYGIKAA